MTPLLQHKKMLDSYAEIGWHEVKTSSYIDLVIKDAPFQKGFGPSQTGRLFKLGNGTRYILLRADIDALNTASGVRHICGHSTHTAALIQAYFHAKSHIKQIDKANISLFFLFQPAEETFPSGASAFLKACPDIVARLSAAYAIHVRPLMKLGTIGLQEGPLWARGDYMEIEVKGTMVHIKNNLQGKDAIYASSLLVVGIKKLQASSPLIRIGVGVISGGRQANTVADSVLLKGDIRLPNDTYQHKIKERLNALIRSVEKKTGTHIRLDYFDGTPPVINDKKITRSITQYLMKRHSTPFSIQKEKQFSYGCEDFAFISQKVPSTVALIGTGDTHDLHEEHCTISDKGTENAFLYFKCVIDSLLSG